MERAPEGSTVREVGVLILNVGDVLLVLRTHESSTTGFCIMIEGRICFICDFRAVSIENILYMMVFFLYW